MPKAWKFVMTATPMKGDEMLCDVTDDANRRWARNKIILLSTFSYMEAHELGYMKYLHASVAAGIAGACFEQVAGGKKKVLVNGSESDGDATHNGNRDNVSLRSATLLRAASALQEDDKKYGYPAHCVIRVHGNRTSAVTEISSLINGHAIPEWPLEPSYGCSVLFSGSHPRPEITDKGEVVEHGTLAEWMLAKKAADDQAAGNDGVYLSPQIPAESKRFLACLQLGQIGLNNWMANVLCLLEVPTMWDMVQRIGRAIRRNKIGEEASVRIVWPSYIGEEVKDVLGRALDYIHNMENHLKNFVRIEDWVDGNSDGVPSVSATPVLNPSQRRAAEAVAADYFVSDRKVPISEFVHSHINPSDKLWDGDSEKVGRAVDVAARLASNEAYRRQFVGVMSPVSRPDVSLVVKDSPPDDFTLDELMAEIKKGTASGLGASITKEEMLEKVASNDTFAISVVRNAVVSRIAKDYELPYVTTPLQNCGSGESKKTGVIPQMARELLEKVPSGMLLGPAAMGEACKAINTVAAWYFHLPNMKKESYELHEVHYVAALMRQEHRGRVLGLAKVLLMHRNADRIPSHAAMYQVVIEDVVRVVAGDVVEVSE
jgi:hypothetical protein